MKLFCVVLLLCALDISAQRRPQRPEETNAEATTQKPRGRGRARFSLTPEYAEASDSLKPDSTNKKTTDAPRRRPDAPRNVVAKPQGFKRPYEVEEVLDDLPNLSARRLPRPRVITETKFEARNAPKQALFQPASSVTPEVISIDELTKSFTTSKVEKPPEGEAEDGVTAGLFDPSTNEQPPSTEASSTEALKPSTETAQRSSEIGDIRRDSGRTKTTTAAPKRGAGRASSRSRASVEAEVPRARSRIRTNTRSDDVRAEEVAQTAPVAQVVSPGHRLASRARDTTSEDVRLKTGRRVTETVTSRQPSSRSDANSKQRSDTRSSRRPVERSRSNTENQNLEASIRTTVVVPSSSTRTTARAQRSTTEKPPTDERNSRRSGSRFQQGTRSSTIGAREATTTKPRALRSRFVPPNIDEQKLEVLPLFENEAATVKISPVQSSNQKKKGALDYEGAADSSNELKYYTPETTVAPSTTAPKKQTTPESSHQTTTRQQGSTTAPKKQTTIPPASSTSTRQPKKSVFKETVEVSRVKEVTTKRKVVRKKKTGKDSSNEVPVTKPDTTKPELPFTFFDNRVTPEWLESVGSPFSSKSVVPDIDNIFKDTTDEPSWRVTYAQGSSSQSNERNSKLITEAPDKRTTEKQNFTTTTYHNWRPTEGSSQNQTPTADKKPLRSTTAAPTREPKSKTTTREYDRYNEVTPRRNNERRNLENRQGVDNQKKNKDNKQTDRSYRSTTEANERRGTTTTTEAPERRSSHRPVSSTTPEKPASSSTTVSTTQTPTTRSRHTTEATSNPKRQTVAQRVKVDEPKVTVTQVVTSSRGRKKVEKSGGSRQKKAEGSQAEEDIDESDNYPEPFKALIQAQKEKGPVSPPTKTSSRPRQSSDSATITRGPEKVTTTTTTTSTTTSSSTTTSEATTRSSTTSAKVEEHENELDPKITNSQRPTRVRFSLTTKAPEANEHHRFNSKRPAGSRKQIRSTTALPLTTQPRRSSSTTTRRVTAPPSSTTTTKDSATSTRSQKFHARFNAANEQEAVAIPSGPGKSLAQPKPLRGQFKTRGRPEVNEKVVKSTKHYAEAQPTFSSQVSVSNAGKKPNSRYSSRYRGDISSRGRGITKPTGPPVYIPTVPTVTPPTQSVKPGIEENELGMEIISFDDPVNTVPSANLISGEYLSSSVAPGVTIDQTSLLSKQDDRLFAKVPKEEGSTTTTKEPGSIIERIINSITAISTTASPDSTVKATTTVEAEPTKGSAILKLANKKSTKLTKNAVTDSPQTVRKRTKPPKTSTTEKPTTIIERILSSLSAIQADGETVSSTQVGTDFTTEKPRTKQSRATTTSSTTTAQTSTTVSPLNVLEQISSEQTLQKSTIGKLLALLNSLTSTTEQDLVVVTPKQTNYIAGTPSNNLIDVEIKTDIPKTTIRPAQRYTSTPTTVETTTKTPVTTTTPKLFTSPIPAPETPTEPPTTLSTRIQETLSSIAKFMTSTFNPNAESTNIPPTTTEKTTTTTITTTTKAPVTANALSISTPTNQKVTTPLTKQRTAAATTESIASTTESTTDNLLTLLSTLPTLANFEADVVQNTVAPVEANALSLSTPSGTKNTTVAPQPPAPTATIQSLSEFLGGKTVQAYSNLINSTKGEQEAKVRTLEVDSRANVTTSTSKPTIATTAPPTTTTATPKPKETTTTAPSTIMKIAVKESTTTMKTTTSSPSTTEMPTVFTTLPSVQPRRKATTTQITTTTTVPTTTQPPTTTTEATTTTKKATTTTVVTTTTPPPTTTTVPPQTTSIRVDITPRSASVRQYTTTYEPYTTASSRMRNRYQDSFSTTSYPSTTPNNIRRRSTTTPPTTMTTERYITSTTRLPPTSTTVFSTTTETHDQSTVANVPSTTIIVPDSLKNLNLKGRKLTEEQKQNLETLRELEKEQAAILQQLALLTNLVPIAGGGATKAPKIDNSLANRILALAMERDKTTTNSPETTSAAGGFNLLEALAPSNTRESTKIANVDGKAASIDDIVKDLNAIGLNSVTPSTLSKTYGNSNDAILAALLKEQGIEPSTPKTLRDRLNLAGLFQRTAPLQTTTTTERPQQRPGGRLIQGISWLFNAFRQPPATKPPKPKTTPKPKEEEELLSKQPTHITPVVDSTARSKSPNSLSEEDLQSLIKQLEAVQKDPKNAEKLDLSALKNLQSGLNNNAAASTQLESVQIINPGAAGSRSRSSTRAPETSVRTRGRKSTTAAPVTNDIYEEDVTSAKSSVTLPPVRLTPIPGIPERSDPRVRGQLINAAVNVTKAISSFFGSALQAAAHQIAKMYANRRHTIRDYVSQALFPNSSISTTEGIPIS